MTLLPIPAKTVQLDDGTLVETAPFEIRAAPVTVAEFRDFTSATGWKTTAELAGEPTYLTNAAVCELTAEERHAARATMVSFDDAIAYCRWRGVRLPTEPEWLAMALQDDSLVPERGMAGYRLAKEITDRIGLRFAPREWVDVAGDGMSAVVRTGPKYFRKINNKGQQRIERHEWPRDSFDLMLGFRFVTTSLPSVPANV